jgi:predicted O-methyltransferase YrrM
MRDLNIEMFNKTVPAEIESIVKAGQEIGFDMPSAPHTGQLLRFLAATKPGGRFLELGTGTGLGTCWLLAGMDSASTLLTVDSKEDHSAIARRFLQADKRVTFHVADGADLIRRLKPGTFDLVFADAQPGKLTLAEETLALLRPGGIYVADDMLPQPDWPDDHYPVAAGIASRLADIGDTYSIGLDWSTGIALITRSFGPVR